MSLASLTTQALNRFPEYLQTYTRFPQTLRVFFGGMAVHFYLFFTTHLCGIGGHDNEYSSTLTALDSEQFLGKLVTVERHDDIPSELRKLCLPSLKLEGLFVPQQLCSLPKRLAPLTMPGSNSVTTNGGLMSPRSPSNSSSSSEKRSIDPSLVRYPQPFKVQMLIVAFSHFTSKTPHRVMNIISCPALRGCVSIYLYYGSH